MNTAYSYARYQRQIGLKNFGEKAQQKLSVANVLVIGAGGLGCPALQYLAAIGVGHIGIVDVDIVSISNIHRQILYDSRDEGILKVNVAKERIQTLNESIEVSIFPAEINQFNALEIIAPYDIVLDCTDNFKARYVINDACVLLNKPLVFGAVYQYEGQLAVFDNKEKAVNYRDLFPVSPAISDAPTCEQVGVYNMVTGIIGIMQASEAIKLITGIGMVLSNQLLIYNSLNSSSYIVDIARNENNHFIIPRNEIEFKNFNYDAFCGIIRDSPKDEITAKEFDELLQHVDIQLVDIRNEDEFPRVDELAALCVPLSDLRSQVHLLDKEKKIILFCHSGIRTKEALEVLQDEFHLQNVSHLKGGIIKWLEYKSNKK